MTTGFSVLDKLGILKYFRPNKLMSQFHGLIPTDELTAIIVDAAIDAYMTCDKTPSERMAQYAYVNARSKLIRRIKRKRIRSFTDVLPDNVTNSNGEPLHIDEVLDISTSGILPEASVFSCVASYLPTLLDNAFRKNIDETSPNENQLEMYIDILTSRHCKQKAESWESLRIRYNRKSLRCLQKAYSRALLHLGIYLRSKDGRAALAELISASNVIPESALELMGDYADDK